MSFISLKLFKKYHDIRVKEKASIAEHCPVLNEDWERFDADHVKSEGLSAAICNKEYLSTCHKTWSAVQFFAYEGGQ